MKAVTAAISGRPRPPADLVGVENATLPDHFMPGPGLMAWIREHYLEADGALFNVDHSHLASAKIECLWTNAENKRRGRPIVGQAELMQNCKHAGKWQRARSDQQIREWFDGIPDFILTIDAIYADEADDAVFCALLDHELYHCAQDTDDSGEPAFNQRTGEPKWKIRGHDVEEFVGVVRRFGVEAAGEQATDFVIAAARAPEITNVSIAHACGTCLKLAA